MVQGEVRSRVPKKSSQAHPGVHPLSALTHTQRFEPLPLPITKPPYHYDLEVAVPGVTKHAASLGKLVFHCVGDTGGVKSPTFQAGVAALMKGDLNLPAATRPQFFYHLGDVVYYNGQTSMYYDQFYEPYDHYNAPIFSVPGNHDGDPIDATQTSLDGWIRYFMTPIPLVQPESHDAPRVTMSQPNVYFTLNCPFVTIIGMYTNVPEGGSVDSVQQQWLTNEFHTAPKDKALIVAMHHPIYSFDDHHSGSSKMADVVQHAINDSRRVPNMVLAAHVHNFQRIEKTIVAAGPTPFIVAGLGGYYHLHGMNGVAGDVDAATGAKLVFEEHDHHGYMTLTVDAKHISGTMHTAANTTGKHQATGPLDAFAYPAGLITLDANAVVSL